MEPEFVVCRVECKQTFNKGSNLWSIRRLARGNSNGTSKGKGVRGKKNLRLKVGKSIL